MNPPYSIEYLDHFYSQYGYDVSLENPTEFMQERRRTLLYEFDNYMRLVERYAQSDTPRKMLDIGCGDGYFLLAAKLKGWSFEGYEVSDRCIASTRKLVGIEPYTGVFDLDVRFPEKYGLVTLHQVLEHVQEPRKYMRQVHSLLAPGGLAFVSVPNIGSLSSTIKFVAEKVGLRKRNIGKYYDTYHHVGYFTTRTLKALLVGLGFEILESGNTLRGDPAEPVVSRWFKERVLHRLYPMSAIFVLARKR